VNSPQSHSAEPTRRASNRQAGLILLMALLLAGGFSLFSCFPCWRAELAETNYQANMVRLQGFLFDSPPQALLVGSSISGRLLPSYFDATPLGKVGNLGLDGSSPTLGLELAARRSAPLILLEANLLLKSNTPNDVLLAEAVASPGFRLGRYLPFMRAQARPSSVLYTWMRSRRSGTVTLSATNAGRAVEDVVRPVELTDGLTNGPVQDRLREEIRGLLEKKSEVVIVRIPSTIQGPTDTNFVFGDVLAREFNLRRLDLPAECARRGLALSFSDGIHLTPDSARQVSRVLAELAARSGKD
jgi:hypothetical protein